VPFQGTRFPTWRGAVRRYRRAVRPTRPGLVAALVVLVAAVTPAAWATDSRPCPGGLAWCATVHPSRGPIGTLVHLRGQIDPGLGPEDTKIYIHNLRADPGAVFLIRDFSSRPSCEFLGGVHAARTRVSDAGVIRGSFIVGGSAACNHSTAKAPPLSPGNYHVNLGCQACSVDEFTVTRGTLPFSGPGQRAGALLLGGLLAIIAGLALDSAGRRTNSSKCC
jgi:hypothetical protein